MLTRAGQGICVFVKYWCCSCWQTALFKATTDAFVCFLWVEKIKCLIKKAGFFTELAFYLVETRRGGGGGVGGGTYG